MRHYIAEISLNVWLNYNKPKHVLDICSRLQDKTDTVVALLCMSFISCAHVDSNLS